MMMGHFVGVMVMLVRAFPHVSIFFRQIINRIWLFKRETTIIEGKKKVQGFFR
jgi:hypothetical protein